MSKTEAETIAEIQAKIPNTVEIGKLQQELSSRLMERRDIELREIELAAARAANDKRLLVLEAALAGVKLGVEHSREAALQPPAGD